MPDFWPWYECVKFWLGWGHVWLGTLLIFNFKLLVVPAELWSFLELHKPFKPSDNLRLPNPSCKICQPKSTLNSEHSLNLMTVFHIACQPSDKQLPFSPLSDSKHQLHHLDVMIHLESTIAVALNFPTLLILRAHVVATEVVLCSFWSSSIQEQCTNHNSRGLSG